MIVFTYMYGFVKIVKDRRAVLRRKTRLILYIFVILSVIVFSLSGVGDVLSSKIRSTRNATKTGALLADFCGQTTIPKIIHQIWNDEIVPGEFVKNVKSLVRDNPPPDWKYYWWTKESGLKLVRDKFPDLLPIISNVSDIMRSDILRYLVIYQYGGVYFDLDTVSVKSLNDFVQSHRCSLALEPAEHLFTARDRKIITNSALFCIQKHPFFQNLILLMYKLPTECIVPLSCTGPFMLSGFYQEFNKTDLFANEVPEIQTSEVFQDFYDHRRQTQKLYKACYNNTKLSTHQRNVCANWIARGKENRNLSELAITYHTWFHILKKKLQLSNENLITKIVPNARIYGKDF